MGADLPDMQKYLEKRAKVLQEYKSAVAKASAEPDHLKALLIKEKEMAEDDDMPLNDEDLANTMEAHKSNSPFALDVAAAQAKYLRVVKE
jgi:hypothetical protein